MSNKSYTLYSFSPTV